MADAQLPLNLEELCSACAGGQSFEYLFFWGHRPNADGSVSKSCFSQWWPAKFEVDGQQYASAEHYMMAEKARLFGDLEIGEQICASESPPEAKALGRKVKNFDAGIWGAECFKIVVAGNVHKFGQDPALREFLLGTGTAVLVEAAPRDRIWGIGMGQGNESASNPAQWRGKNLLGFALMKARQQLR